MSVPVSAGGGTGGTHHISKETRRRLLCLPGCLPSSWAPALPSPTPPPAHSPTRQRRREPHPLEKRGFLFYKTPVRIPVLPLQTEHHLLISSPQKLKG